MAHTLIVGITGSGKTTVAKNLAVTYRRRGVGVLVLTPCLHDGWESDYITDNPELFLQVVFLNRNCAIFVDECGEMIGRWAGPMTKLATRSRHWGHNVHFIGQRATMIDPNVRSMCECFFIFKQSATDAKIVAIESACDVFLDAATLKKGQCLAKIGIDGKCRLIKVF